MLKNQTVGVFDSSKENDHDKFSDPKTSGYFSPVISSIKCGLYEFKYPSISLFPSCASMILPCGSVQNNFIWDLTWSSIWFWLTFISDDASNTHQGHATRDETPARPWYNRPKHEPPYSFEYQKSWADRHYWILKFGSSRRICHLEAQFYWYPVSIVWIVALHHNMIKPREQLRLFPQEDIISGCASWSMKSRFPSIDQELWSMACSRSNSHETIGRAYHASPRASLSSSTASSSENSPIKEISTRPSTMATRGQR